MICNLKQEKWEKVGEREYPGGGVHTATQNLYNLFMGGKDV